MLTMQGGATRAAGRIVAGFGTLASSIIFGKTSRKRDRERPNHSNNPSILFTINDHSLAESSIVTTKPQSLHCAALDIKSFPNLQHSAY